MSRLDPVDIDHVLRHTSELWPETRSANFFITGGTGFFGRWILETLLAANDRFGLEISATVLTRNPASFAISAPHIAAHPAIQLAAGNVIDFTFPSGEFRYIVHAATDSGGNQVSIDTFATIVEGTGRVLQFAASHGTQKFLLTSSGAVYGRQPPQLSHIPEGYNGAPDPADARSVYGEGKRAAELLCALYADSYGIDCTIARCFAFAGPRLPLDAHFAIGNFIRDAMRGGVLQIKGDGSPYRSYLYTADLAVWLWTILLKGKPARPYNVGSEEAVSIAELAREVAGCLNPAASVNIAAEPVPGREAERYVPSTARARLELGLSQHIPLREAIRRTAAWHGFTSC